MQKRYRVMIVDDSPLLRTMLRDVFDGQPDLEVVGVAEDGEKAVAAFDKLQPDVVTLDVQMPRMDGLATLEALLKKRPLPVVMCSALTSLGADTTLQAMERGAVDFVAKPNRLDEAFKQDLLRKVRVACGVNITRLLASRQARQARFHAKPAASDSSIGSAVSADVFADKLVAIGISTGGPPALSRLFETLKGPLPPVVIVQHMPPHFTKALAGRLNGMSSLTISEAAEGDVLQPNHVYLAPGGFQLGMTKHGRTARLTVVDGPQVSGHKPSVDHMMQAAVQAFGNRILGVIMTGMGRDGSDGCGMVRKAGGYVLGQDEGSSDVYGMNKVAMVEGNVDRQVSLDDMAGAMMSQVRKMWAPTMARA